MNPYKAVRFNITFQQQVMKGLEGEPFWLAEINTTEPSVSGTQIASEYLHLRTLINMDVEIEKAVSNICKQIDWAPQIDDTRGPIVTDYSPSETTDVSIDSNIQLTINDLLPSAGIDVSSIKVTLNGLDITGKLDITGDPYEYKVKWKPSTIVYDTY